MQADVESTLCRNTQTKAGLLQMREALTKDSLSLSDQVPEMAKKSLHRTAVMKYLHHISPHARVAARGKI